VHRGGDVDRRNGKGEGVKNLIDGMMGDAKSLLLGALVLMAIAFVIMTWARTRSLVPTIGAVLLGAFIVALVSNYTIISDQVDEDINRYTTTDNAPIAEQGGG
jgi:hypothetical protein